MAAKVELGLLVLPLVFLTACEVDLGHPSGPPRTEQVSLDLGKTEMARVEIRMKMGQLRVSSGASKLIEGELRYRDPEKPTVRTDSSSFRTTVFIDQTSHGHTSTRGDEYSWNLRLNQDTPLDLQLDFGVGQGKLDLGDLNLRTLDVHMGVGELHIDLRGNPKHDYSLTVHGGVGQATIVFPSGVGVVAEARGGLGAVKVRGLEKSDGRYVNSAFGHSKVTIRADVTGGIGEINLISE
jgi:hypothetical protein